MNFLYMLQNTGLYFVGLACWLMEQLISYIVIVATYAWVEGTIVAKLFPSQTILRGNQQRVGVPMRHRER